MSTENWERDDIQFPRLLCEIVAVQDNLDISGLAESMDLTTAEVNELFDRAHRAWEKAKQAQQEECNPEEVLQRAERTLTHCEWSETVEALNDYWTWRIKGGFEPHNGDHRAECVAESLADCLSNIDITTAKVRDNG